MIERVDVHHGAYHDSVSLMRVSRAAAATDGVDAALVAMATELNLGFLAQMGFDAGSVEGAGPNDVFIALRAADEAALTAGLQAVDAALAATASGRASRELGSGPTPRTFRTAARLRDLDIALISVPGEHAFSEAVDALDADLNVMVFSDNVPLAREVTLKRLAKERGRLVMGPDAGTAIIGGIGLGFANAVRPGAVGVVAASGTGAQQLTCLFDDAGVGVSHVLGVGGRDLSEEVGGASTLQALAALDHDPATELIVVLSKPPAPAVAERVRAAAHACATPTVIGFLGDGADLTEIAAQALRRLGREPLEPSAWPVQRTRQAEGTRQTRGTRLVGLFAGGTLCAEALGIAAARLGPVASNVAGDAPVEAGAHLLLDLGADEFTVGRPHPMIDQQLRIERLRHEAEDPRTSVVLLDVVLGWGAHPDPAAELAPVIARTCEERREAGREIAVVVSLCGAAGDPQDRDRQARVLHEAGASVHLSNAAAAREAVALVAEAPA